MIRLGLLQIEGDRWVKSKKKLVLPTHRSERAVREFHSQMIEKAKVALSKTDDSEFEARDITGTTMPVDPRRIAEAKKKIWKFRCELLDFLSSGECTELYQLNVQLFRLTEVPLARIEAKGTK